MFNTHNKIKKALLSYKKPASIKAISSLDPKSYEIDIKDTDFGRINPALQRIY